MLQLKPSTYNSELQLSTEERMLKLIKPFRKCNSFESQEMEVSTPFTPIPRVMIFQNYVPGKTYTAQLVVRNDTNVLKPLNVIYKNTANFTVIPSIKKSAYLAPGMSVSFRIQFSPDKKQDCTNYIKFCSCEDHFVVPVVAIGPRPMLDFPDQIQMPCTPVKIPVTKYFLVKNIGEIEAIFSLSTDRSEVYHEKMVDMAVERH
ncbi:hydrocephalus-inducing protein homolog [Schistocerca cancellata]|uniref:hydrocephalus-inducing protein homolog n=1 Tax=Schistocerca cancellata TaxID=274614 RepID=UPI002117456F|nr:hydrocephalus-inducing protein homolog [Schistocerca cancellata]